MNMQFFREKKGFTLIELLVVIAIIGILAAIVLVSLSGARDRAKDARITTDMSQLRTAAEVYQGNNQTYTGFCTDADTVALQTDITNQGGTSYACHESATAYCVEVLLNGGEYWCVDSGLISKQYAADPICAVASIACE